MSTASVQHCVGVLIVAVIVGVFTGDFKAENLFFTDEQPPKCCVVDFQWAGGGNPCIDVVYLLLTSLDDGQWLDLETECLHFYRDQLALSLSTDAPSFESLFADFELCLIDFLRFALGDGPLIEADLALCRRVDAILTKIDRGTVLEPNEFAQRLQKVR